MGPLVFCIPIYNDWDCAAVLLTQIDAVVMANRWNASVLFVDDGSTESLPSLAGEAVTHVEILRLRQNLGHQRAIAIAIAYLHAERQFEAAIVMDGDGEDAPRDVPTLLQVYSRHHGERVVFAKRSRRSEGITFKAGYQIFKALHWILTGRCVQVGNFSVIPRRQLERLLAVPELWNHYAAACLKADLPRDLVPIARSSRLRGKSKMSLAGLILHGIRAMAVHRREIIVRLSTATLAIAVYGMVSALGLKMLAPILAGLLLAVTPIWLLFSIALRIPTMRRRGVSDCLPLRDYSHYVSSGQRIVGV
jgi:glycosyltransferase involved in cell wall biosynthesis